MRSIQTKIVALIMSCVVLVTVTFGFFVYINTNRLLKDKAQEHMLMSCEINSDKLNEAVTQIRSSVNTLASYALFNLTNVQVLQNNSWRDRYLRNLRNTSIDRFQYMDGVVGVYARFDIAVTQTADACGFYYTRAGGEDTFTEQSLTDIELYDPADTAAVGWWFEPQLAGESVWVDAYTNVRTGQQVSSYVVPLYFDDTFLGVIGIDMAVSYLGEVAQAIALFDTGFATILSDDGSVVYHPEYVFGTPLSAVEPSFRGVLEKIRTDGLCYELLSYKMNGGRRHLAFSRLDCDMWLCICAPDAEIYFDLYNLLVTLSVLLIIFASAALCAAVYVTRRMTKPLKQLNHAARQLTRGNFDASIEPSTRDEIGELTISFMHAQEKLKLRINTLYDEAHMDGLTGVQNKTALVDREQALNLHIRQGNAAFTVAVLDVNRLKITNDILGHTAGDELLRTVAQHLANSFSLNDVFRIGGDEFVVLLEGEDAQEQIARVDDCVHRFADCSLPKYPDIGISCACGTAVFDAKTDTSFEQVLARADQAMYQNKSLDRQQSDADTAKSTRRVQVEKYLEFLRILSQSTEDYLFLYDVETDGLWFFGDIRRNFDIGEEDDRPCPLERLFTIAHPADRQTLMLDLQKVINGAAHEHRMEYRWIDRDGNAVWIDCRGQVVRDVAGTPFVMIGRVSDTALQALYHPLTGMFNKTKLEQDIRTNTIAPFTHVMLVRIDNLTAISIKYGKRQADELLLTVAHTLEERFPAPSLYHTERDTFALLLHTVSAEQIQDIFDHLQTLDRHMILSAAVVPNDPSFYIDNDNIYETARELFDEHSRTGSRSISYFSQEDIRRRLSKADLLEEIEYSIKHDFDGFYLQYQPQVRGIDYKIVSAEALLRYRSGDNDPVYPDKFIPLLEETKLIRPVGKYALDRALAMCRIWRTMEPDFRVAVNFSSIQLREDGIAEEVLALLDKHALPGHALTIELTETVELGAMNEFSDLFTTFQKHGIRIAIDDFGTGYANLGYLKSIHADEIKIDRMFVKDLKENSYNYTILNSITDFAKANAFDICIEGIENTDELAVLEGLSPEYLQGYLFSRPIDPQTLTSLYLRPNGDGHAPTPPFLRQLQKSRDELRVMHVDTKSILSKIRIGLWVIRLNTVKDSAEMFADFMMTHELLGIDTPCDGEACYEFWNSRIEPQHRTRVNDMMAHMLECDQVTQVEYTWHHPTRGPLTVRCTGKCVTKSDTTLVFEGFHRIISDMGVI